MREEEHGRMSPPCTDAETGLPSTAPRIEAPNCCVRFSLVGTCLVCSCVGLGLLAAGAVVLHDAMTPAAPAPVDAFRAAQRASAPSARRPLPALLQRFALLEKAVAPDHGVDPESLHHVFPTWHATPDAGLRDLALAIKLLAEQLAFPELESASSPLLESEL